MKKLQRQGGPHEYHQTYSCFIDHYCTTLSPEAPPNSGAPSLSSTHSTATLSAPLATISHSSHPIHPKPPITFLLPAWTPHDPDAAWSYPTKKGTIFGYKVHTLLDRVSRLPIFFLVSPANKHDLPFAYWLLWLAKKLFGLPLRIVRADAAYWGLSFIKFVVNLGAQPIIPFNRKRKLLSRVRYLVQKGLNYSARAVIERFFAVVKNYYGLDGRYAIGSQQVIRHVPLTYISTLIVALVAYQLRAPHLALSPTRVLVHLTILEEV